MSPKAKFLRDYWEQASQFIAPRHSEMLARLRDGETIKSLAHEYDMSRANLVHIVSKIEDKVRRKVREQRDDRRRDIIRAWRAGEMPPAAAMQAVAELENDPRTRPEELSRFQACDRLGLELSTRASRAVETLAPKDLDDLESKLGELDQMKGFGKLTLAQIKREIAFARQNMKPPGAP